MLWITGLPDGLVEGDEFAIGEQVWESQEVMKGQLPLSMWRLCGQGVELFGCGKPLASSQLPLLDHVHEFHASQSRCQRSPQRI